ncbi:MAG TPA: SusC/RagA family TonB-linked outer membrane protein, partial [Chitinophagaceae bacterium]|nr:SusC/RagA family TonB-linked outer membrane protein [Chitinophagaceae bacterium]
LNSLIAEGAAPVGNEVGNIAGGGTDWQSEIFQKNAVVQSHNLSLTGGNNKTNYFVSLNYFDQNGTVKSSEFRRYSARVNLHIQATENLEFGLNLNTSYSMNDYAPVGFGINGEAGTIYNALNFDPTLPVRDTAGAYTISPFLDLDNPLAEIYGKNAKAQTFRTYGTIYGKYTILPGLFAKLNLGGDVLNERKDVYVNRLTKHGAPAGGIATILEAQKSNYLVEATLTYDRSFGSQHLNVVLGTTTQRFVTQSTNMGASGFPADATTTNSIGLGNQATYTLGSGKASNRLLSYLGRVNYNIQGKYLLTGSFRIDGSSRFGINNRFGYFPSFAAAWKINEEHFMQGVSAVSTLKLRASWGQTGNQAIGDYAALTTFSSGPIAILDDKPVSSTVPARLPNPDLKWETTAQTDIGLDFGFFDQRIAGSIDYYSKRTYDMLLALPVPTSTGFSSKLSNVGSIRNTGWEFTLNTQNLTGPFSWSSNVSLSTIKNKVLDLGGIPQIITGAAGQTSQIFLTKPGLSLYSFYGYKIIGVWQKGDDFSKTKDNVQPGDLKYADVNGDGTVNGDDRVQLGNSFPKFTWSFGNSFSYKRFQLDIFLEGSQGVKMLNNNLVDAYFPVQFRRNRFAEPYLNRWTPDHPSNKYPSFVNPTGQGNKLVNSYTVEDASYARIKTVTLGYHFNIRNSFIQSARVYVTGENLILLTGYDGYDPAVNPNGNAFRRIDFNAYPVARTFILGLSVNF